MEQKKTFEITSAGLHMLAMALMLCDHIWATLPAPGWFTSVGRVAYPIFAFLLAEGYFHTHNLRRYLGRLLVWALISELPFNLMYGGSAIYPFHQNVLWTFLLSLLLLALLDRIRSRFALPLAVPLCLGAAGLGFLLGYAAMVDYYGVGVLMVLTFYLFHGRTWRDFLGQLVCLFILNVQLLGGLYYGISIFGFQIELAQQGLALLALLPIWLYRGRQGLHSRGFQLFCYAFYPAHMLLLCLAAYLVA